MNNSSCLFLISAKETGTTISFVTDKEGTLMQKLKTEGANSPADILLTVDAGNLWLASKEGLLQPIKSKILSENIPAHLRDNLWVGLRRLSPTKME